MKIIEVTEYVVGFMIQPEKEQVLFILKNRPAFQKGKWNGVGGKVERGEHPRQAMVREFREETGVDTPPWSWEHTVSLGVRNDYVVHYYRSFVTEFPVYQTVTDEQVSVWDIDDVYTTDHTNIDRIGNWTKVYDCPTLPNMRWILAMQLSQHILFPINVTHQDSH